MSIHNIRFRMDGEKVVLQVNADRETYPAYHGYGDSAQWRDAKAEDLLDVAECMRMKYERRIEVSQHMDSDFGSIFKSIEP